MITPESPKDKLRTKFMYSKIITKMSDIPVFKAHLFNYLLPMISYEYLANL